MRSRIVIVLGGPALVCLMIVPVAAAQNSDIPRTTNGRPDLSGTYDVSTLTPMERPTEVGEKMELTDEEAAELAERTRQAMAFANRRSDPNRGAPPQGGDGSPGASGSVGGYNAFWIDPGEGAFQVDGQWRTSILIDPRNGRFPPRVDGSSTGGGGGGRANDGTAYWLEAGLEAPGPYDNMEQRPTPNAASSASARHRAPRCCRRSTTITNGSCRVRTPC